MEQVYSHVISQSLSTYSFIVHTEQNRGRLNQQHIHIVSLRKPSLFKLISILKFSFLSLLMQHFCLFYFLKICHRSILIECFCEYSNHCLLFLNREYISYSAHQSSVVSAVHTQLENIHKEYKFLWLTLILWRCYCWNRSCMC